MRSGLKAQVHAVMDKHGVLPARGDMFGPGGTAQLDALELPMAYSFRLESLRDLIAAYTRDIVSLDRRIHTALKDDPGYNAIQAIHGVGPVLAAVFVAEIGDVTRFPSPDRLCSWAGLTPRHRESDTKVRRGSITNRAPSSCDGPPSRPSAATMGTARSKPTITASPSGGVATSAASPRPAERSASSTTACVTARTVASRRPREAEPARTRPADGLS